jgi:hypothetical protein
MINPFDIQQPPPESSNVSTGLKVSTEVQESLLKSVDTGNDMVKTFVGSALSVGKSGSFYDRCRSVFIVRFVVRGSQPRSDFHCCTDVSHDMSCNVPSDQCRFLSGETNNTLEFGTCSC